MSEVALKGHSVQLEGALPDIGSVAPDFLLVGEDLSEINLEKFKDKIKIVAAMPSVDTSVCAQESREFHKRASGLRDTAVIVVSGDLPFALKRFCAAEGIDNITVASQYRDMNFGRSYGTHIATGPLKGLSARAVFVLDRSNRVVYSELVPEITAEPNYDKAIAAVEGLLS